MPQTTGVKIVLDKTANLIKAIAGIGSSRLMVGVPSEKNDRGEPINNATLAYIHENGAPAANIPARPFLKPTIDANKDEIAAALKRAAQQAFAGNTQAMNATLHRIGASTRDAVKTRIRSNIPPPLALSTVMNRIYRRKSKTYRKKRIAQVKANVAAGVAPQTGLFISLIDTGQLQNSITYVIRKIGAAK